MTVTKEWIDGLTSYHSESTAILVWLREQVDMDIGWVLWIEVLWEDAVTARVSIHCHGDVDMTFMYNIETQHVSICSYRF